MFYSTKLWRTKKTHALGVCYVGAVRAGAMQCYNVKCFSFFFKLYSLLKFHKMTLCLSLQ